VEISVWPVGKTSLCQKDGRLGYPVFIPDETYGVYVEALSFATLNVALQNKLGNGANLTLSVDDALNTFEFRNETSIPAQNFFAEQGFDPSRPTFKVSYSASFVNGLDKRLNRESAAEEWGRTN